jgi:rare lipoprotein A
MRLLLTALILSVVLAPPAEARKPAAEQKGVASFYGWRHHGRRMANGKRFNALGSSAASRTLPLGSRARVTNLSNGKSADVTIEDRGPYVKGRILDLSLGTARRLGMSHQGVARVRIKPLPGRP